MPEPQQQQQIPTAPVGNLTPLEPSQSGGVPKAPVGKLTPIQGPFEQRAQPTQGPLPIVPTAPVGKLTPIPTSHPGQQMAPPGYKEPSWGESFQQMDPFLSGLKMLNQKAEEMGVWGSQHGAQAAQQFMQMPHSWSAQAPTPESIGYARSVGGLAGGLATDPRQWLLMSAMGGASAPLRALADVAFGAQMGHGVVEQAGQYGSIMDNPDVPEEIKAEMRGSMGLQALMAGLSGGGAYGNILEGLKPYETPGAIRTDQRQPSPTAAATTARQPAQPTPEDPYLKALGAMRQRQSFGQEGGPQPTVETASQMGAGAVGQKGIAPTPEGIQQESALDQATRRAPFRPTPEVPVDRRVGGEEARAQWDQQQAALRAQGQLGQPTPQPPLQQPQVADPATLQAELQRGMPGLMAERQQQPVAPVPPTAVPKAPVGQLRPATEQPSFELPKRKPDLTAAFPQRRIGEQTPTDVDALIKSQVARGDLTREEAARILAKRYGQEPKEPGFRFSALDPSQQSRLVESTAAKQNLVKGEVGAPPSKEPLPAAKATPPAPSAPVSAGPRPTGKEPVPTAQPLAEKAPKTPVEGPGKPVEPTSVAPSPATSETLEQRVRRLAGPEKAKEIDAMKSGLQKTAAKNKEDFGKVWERALQQYGRQFMRNAPRPGQEGFLNMWDRKRIGKVTPTGVELEARGEEQPKSVAERLESWNEQFRAARRLDNRIFDLEKGKEADTTMSRRVIEGYSKRKESYADHRAVQEHFESGGKTSLTPKQEEIKKMVDLRRQELKMEFEKAEKRGLSPDNYVARHVLKPTSKVSQVLLGAQKWTSGAALSQFTGHLKRASYGVAESPAGRVVISTKLDKAGDPIVYSWYKNKAEKMGPQADLEKLGWTFSRGTTKEIAGQTGLKYLEHAGINTELALMEMKRVNRAADAMEAYKESPDFEKFAYKGKNPPEGWRKVKSGVGLGPLEDYHFNPKTADVLDRYQKRITRGDSNAFQTLNSYLRASIFWNPYIHVPNIRDHWFVEKGVSGHMPQAWPRRVKTSYMAIRDVLSQNENFQKAKDAGVPLMSDRLTNRKLDSIIYTSVVKEIAENPGLASKLATTLGYAHPAQLLRGLTEMSSKVTWISQDLAMLEATYDRMYRGHETWTPNLTKQKMSMEEAFREVSKHIPDYQVPTHVLNSKFLGKLMGESNPFMFGPYHYGAHKSYFEIAKELVHPNMPAAERLKAVDRIAAITLLMYGYHRFRQMRREQTGDPKLEERFPGPTTTPHNIERLMKGEKSLVDVGKAVFTPTPLLDVASNVLSPRYSAQERKKGVGEQIGDIGKEILGRTGPVSAAQRAAPGPSKTPFGQRFDWQRFMQNMFGEYPSTPKRATGGLPKLGGLQKFPKGPK